jgi:hypothetical protein
MFQRGSTRDRTAGVLCIALLCACVAGRPSDALAVDATGTALGGGTADLVYPYVGAPLLSGFALQFEQQRQCAIFGLFCRWRNVDKDVRVIEVTPRAEGLGRLMVTYRDDSQDDSFRYAARHHSFGAPTRRTHRTSKFCASPDPQPRPCRLPSTRPPAVAALRDGVFVLVGFKIEYHHQDDSLSRIAIRQEDDAVVVDFGDAHPPEFAYHAYNAEVDYAWVPRGALREVGRSHGTMLDRTGMVVPDDIPTGKVVVRGFDLRFTEGRERKIKRVAVLAPGGPTQRGVAFADKDGEESFDWTVEWAILGSALVDPDPIYRSEPAAIR